MSLLSDTQLGHFIWMRFAIHQNQTRFHISRKCLVTEKMKQQVVAPFDFNTSKRNEIKHT